MGRSTTGLLRSSPSSGRKDKRQSMSSTGAGGVDQARAVMRIFDAHCHLQDPRIAAVAPRLIRTALDSGVRRFAVNGVSEKDWHLVKQLSEEYPSVIPCFGLHPWFVEERTPNWFTSLKELMVNTPVAAIGEIGIDKGSHGKKIDFADQVDVFGKQLEFAKELEKPVSIHCVRAFGDLLDIMLRTGPFPAGAILHSYLGSAELIPAFAKLGCYFSFSGFLTSIKPQKAKNMLKSVPMDRILIETDAPDGLPINVDNLLPIPTDASSRKGLQDQSGVSAAEEKSEPLNHPANIRSVLKFVAEMLDMPEEELAEVSFQNAARVFSYPGSKVGSDG